MAENVLKRDWMVKPSECNANQELPLTILVSQMIDLATDHANELGIGFLTLEPRGLGWVLSRLSVEMARWPRNGEVYTLSTWIEAYNSHFSERCFSICSSSAEVIGFGRTIWMIIDLESHKSLGTAGTVMPEEMVPALPCPIPKMTRHRSFNPDRTASYQFKYCDLDFYRHVNTVRYISILLNQFTLEDFDTHLLSRFDIAFVHEAKYGETALIKSIDEVVAAPGILPMASQSIKRSFEMSVGSQQVLSAAVILSKL